jgi:hypothetical protein
LKSLFGFLTYIIFFFNQSAVIGVDIPSDDTFELTETIPKIKVKDKTPKVYFDYFEPRDKAHRELVSNYISLVEKNQIYEDPHWIHLLRYKKGIFGGYFSEVVSDDYFLSEEGKSKPRRELLASIRAIFSNSSENTDLDPQCIFPERYRWIRSKLKIGNEVIKPICSRYETWKSGLHTEKVKLVFASYYLQSPASMFGHTFLKLDNKQNINSELLDYGVGYAANPGDVDPLRYVVGGLFGGYSGKFNLFPYYLKVNEYNDLENRDLWEYEMEMNESEKEIFMGHIWEMGAAEFDYYFQKENCAYQILRLIEVVKHMEMELENDLTISPLDLLKKMKAKQIFKNKDPVFRPSLYTKIYSQIIEMNEVEQRLYWDNLDLLKKEKEISTQELESKIVSALLDSYLYLFPDEEKRNNHKSYYSLLQMQSKMGATEASERKNSISEPPDSAHGGRRLSLGYGNSSMGNFAEMESRLAYHDLLNVSRGLLSSSEIQFLNFKVRNYENKKQEITSFSLVRLSSISPNNSLSNKFSYQIDLGSQTIAFQNPEIRKAVGNFDLLGGYSFSNEFSKGFHFGTISLLGGLKTQTNSEFRYGMRYGPQIMIHYLYELGNVKLQWIYSYSYLAMSSNENYFQNTMRIRYALNESHELRVEYTVYPFYSESFLSYHLLF